MLATRWICLLRRIGLMLGLYSFLRLLFFFFHHALFGDVSAIRVIQAFAYGLRFDLSALVAINFPFILLTFVPPKPILNPCYERGLKALFFALNIPFLIINIIDLEYFNFVGRRSNLQLFSLAGDAGVKLSALALSYWPLVLLGLFMIAFLFLLYGKDQGPSPLGKDPNLWRWALNLVLIFPLLVIIFRGGLQWRPISPAQAMVLHHPGLAPLALNSSFTVLKSYKKKALIRRDYFSSRG